jgi:putative phage-type endonuclease
MSALATYPALHSAAWFEDRRRGIGSSDAPIITGDAPWGDVQQLWAIKTNLVDEEALELPRTTWGLRLEQAVAEAYEERESLRLERPVKVRKVNRPVQHRELPWMRASLDRVVVGEKRVVELKTARFPDDKWGPDGTAEIPEHYLVQVQHQLAVTGYEVADVPVLFSGFDLRVYTVPRDAEMIDALIELEREFWQCVVDRTPPVAIIARGSRRVVPLRDGELQADAELDELLVQGHAARAEKKAAEQRSDEIDALVKARLEEWTACRGSSVDALYKPNRDGKTVAWELIAKAYRKALLVPDASGSFIGDGKSREELEAELDALESMFTTPKTGARPLLYRPHKEASE